MLVAVQAAGDPHRPRSGTSCSSTSAAAGWPAWACGSWSISAATNRAGTRAGMPLAAGSAGARPSWKASERKAVLSRAAAWLGSISFSFYLAHGLVIGVAFKLCVHFGWKPSGIKDGLLFAMLCLPLTTAVSAVTYYLIELPFLSLRRNYRQAQRGGVLVAEREKAPPAEASGAS
ncbi:acyltransferase family protein [Ramlibacter sp. Leaf400]|uniref:acyltransferase family protein n=1 Tax=Ramlibacter sp. Leaf400 TaxID=1736365 RepID=UPI0007163EDD|nr:acyltransferase [Ramlibacter sp. Leaf400]KQT14379.1 hypothetical protein ASG30_02035 [Ramlibacter sp. Leaf400]